MANTREQKPIVHSKKHLARLDRERRQTRLILAGFIGILVIVIGLIIYGYVDIKYLQPSRPVAEVGDTGIPVKSWQTRVRMERARLINQIQLYSQYQQYLGVDLSAQQQQILAQLNNSATIGQTVIDQMIDEEVIRREAAASGITASAQDVEQAIQAAYSYFPLGTPTATVTPTAVASPTLSPETLALVTITPTATVMPTPSVEPTSTQSPETSPTAVASSSPTPTAGPSATPLPTATPLTQQGFEDAFKSSVDQMAKMGLSEEQLRQLYEVQILRQRLLDKVTADVPHTQEQVWARHILVPDEAVAKVVRQRLVEGEDFAKVAAELSTDTSNKDKGGDLGWFAKGAMVPEFEAAAFSLKVGEISQPIKTQFGYHIIQVLAHGNVALSADAYEQARQSAFATFLAEARKKYNVVIHDNWRSIVPTDPAAPAAQ
ncbi:MAG TPA: peptidylprolyl isomerase [Anaerolineales bacterium]|nr:peptidylprolyl isomerase [Anaerolineales bacterium]